MSFTSSKTTLEAKIAELQPTSWAHLATLTDTPVSTIKSAAHKFGLKLARPVKEPPAPKPAPDPQRELELKELRRRNRQLETGAATDERVLQRLEAAIKEVPIPPARSTTKPTRSKGRTAQELVLLYSDLHASEVVSLEGTRGINEYSWDIMEARMWRILDTIQSHVDHFAFDISAIHIMMLGDMLSGDIHEELAITNDRPTAECVVDLAYLHLRWIEALGSMFPAVKVSAVCGNHPRRAKKPSAKEYYNNSDWLFYHMLKIATRGLGLDLEFDIPRSAMNVMTVAERWRVLQMHGDGIRSTMPGVPWGGVHRRITTLEAQFAKARQPLDYVVLGHWHTQNAIDGIQAKTYMNGSVKGADEYSLQQFGSGRQAAQTLMTFHPKRGWTGTYACELQESIPAGEGW